MKACALTDVGKTRKTNQDYIFSSNEPVGGLPNLFVVADGMGGHRAGDYASRYIVENLVTYLQYAKGSQIVSLLSEGIKRVNHMLYQEALKNTEFAGMGSTLVCAVADGDTMVVSNVGDSRLYLVHNHISQVTRDHSYVEELVSMGQMVRNSEDYKSKKNIITRAVGTEENLQVDFYEVSLQPGDYILLCSDGLSNMLEDREMEEIILSAVTLQEKVQTLITSANDHGGRDNIAVVLIEADNGREVEVCS